MAKGLNSGAWSLPACERVVDPIAEGLEGRRVSGNGLLNDL